MKRVMANHPTLTSDQVVLRALRELCSAAGEPARQPKREAEGRRSEPPSLPSSVRVLRPEDERPY